MSLEGSRPPHPSRRALRAFLRMRRSEGGARVWNNSCMLGWVCLAVFDCRIRPVKLSRPADPADHRVRARWCDRHVGRQIINDLGEALGQPVIIENRPGANGYLAWNQSHHPSPMATRSSSPRTLSRSAKRCTKRRTSPFDPLTQYVGIAGIATSPSVLVVANNVPVNSVAELVALFARRYLRS